MLLCITRILIGSVPAIRGVRISLVIAFGGGLRGLPPGVVPVLGASCVHGQLPVGGSEAPVGGGVSLVGCQGGPAR
jgi:hypothetical protein